MSDTPAAPEKIPADVLVARYILVRDKIKAAEEAHKEKLKPVKEILETLGNQLLGTLNDIGGDSIKTEHGTAYRIEKNTASLEDPAAFQDHVIANEQFDMLDWKANVKAVQDYITEYGETPPGVKYSTMFTIGVRRA
jgi:hypothetical protein